MSLTLFRSEAFMGGRGKFMNITAVRANVVINPRRSGTGERKALCCWEFMTNKVSLKHGGGMHANMMSKRAVKYIKLRICPLTEARLFRYLISQFPGTELIEAHQLGIDEKVCLWESESRSAFQTTSEAIMISSILRLGSLLFENKLNV